MRTKAIIFDMDGVLVDVSESFRLATKKTAEFFTDEEVEMDEIQNYKNMGGYNDDFDLTEAIILSRNVQISKEEIIKKFIEFYTQLVVHEEWLLNKDIIKKLKEKYKLGIYTGRDRREVAYHQEKVKDFDVIVTVDDVGDRKKPDPYGLQLTMGKLGVKEAIYVGDAVDDMRMASNLGVVAVGVVPAGVDTEDDEIKGLLKENGASLVLNNVNEIVGI